MISYDKALKTLVSYAAKQQDWLKVRECNLEESVGQILSKDLYSEESLPAFTSSAMDGYGICWADGNACENFAETFFEVVGESSAGKPFSKGLEPGLNQACRIMTGALVPPEADTVIKVEHSDRETHKAGFVRFTELPRSGANIRQAGEDLPKGRKIAEAGQKIGAKEILLFTTLGIRKVPVFSDFSVEIVSTGSELCEGGQAPDVHRGQIRNSTKPFLETSLKNFGLNDLTVSSVSDQPDEMIRHFRQALSRKPSLILTTGGVSAGKYDYLPSVVKDLGGEILFHKVAIRPGKPVLVAYFADGSEGLPTMLFGLPGNPVSTMTGFQFFVNPYLKRLFNQSGETGIRLPVVEPVANESGLTRFVRASAIRGDDGRLYVKPLMQQGSHMVGQLSFMNCWIQLSPGQKFVQKGESVMIRFQDYPEFI